MRGHHAALRHQQHAAMRAQIVGKLHPFAQLRRPDLRDGRRDAEARRIPHQLDEARDQLRVVTHVRLRTQHVDRLLDRMRRADFAVAQPFEIARDRDDPRPDRDRVADQPVRRAAAVEALVLVQHNRRDLVQLGDRRQHHLRTQRMLLEHAVLVGRHPRERLVQQFVRQRQLADAVQQPREIDVLCVQFAHPGRQREPPRDLADPHRMPARGPAAQLDHARAHLDHRGETAFQVALRRFEKHHGLAELLGARANLRFEVGIEPAQRVVLRFGEGRQPRRFATQTALLQRLLDGQQQVVIVPRLVQVAIHAAFVDGLHDRRDLRIAGQQDTHRVRVQLPRARQEFRAAHVRHPHVGHDQVDVGRRQDLERGLAAVGRRDVVAGGPEYAPERRQHVRFVVDEQDRRYAGRFTGCHRGVGRFGRHGIQVVC